MKLEFTHSEMAPSERIFYESLRMHSNGFILDNCDIALKLDDLNVDNALADKLICLADQLSNGNTSAVKVHSLFNEDSRADSCHHYSLGLFQISNDWCNNQEDERFRNCKRNGCQLDCLSKFREEYIKHCSIFDINNTKPKFYQLELLDDDITDDINCIKSIHLLTGFTSWPAVKVNECGLGSNDQTKDWNISECLTEERKRRRRLTSIPLWAALLIVAISCFSVFVLMFFFYRHRRNNVTILSPSDIKEFKYGRLVSVKHPLRSIRMSELVQDTFIDEPYNADYEVTSSQFAIGKVVAAKTVKPQSTKEYLQSLLGEIKILTHIGRHDFIVNLEAAYTKDLNKGTVYLFMEFCGLGSLEKFLRSNRNNFISIEQFEESNLPSACEVTSQNLHGKCLTIKHLLQYGHQIAKGMEFLSSKQVIHGDLASRNILLVDHNVAKISDFGLSRKLYGYIQYIKKKEEPLPWRWMAIESLKEMSFSTASDVWMYGVLLFEIFSLGEVPYPGLSWSLEFVDNLEQGFRMLKPKHAPVNLYKDIMLKCWEISPNQRPSFSDLSRYFYQALNTITAKDYTQLYVGDLNAALSKIQK